MAGEWRDCTEAFPDFDRAEVRDNGDGIATVRMWAGGTDVYLTFRLRIDRIYSGLLEKVRR